MANVSLSAAGDTLYAYLSGEIDHDAAQYLRLRIDDALVCRSPRVLVMDFAGVGFMDSSGVGALGGRLQVQHAPPQLRRVLSLAQIACTSSEENAKEEGGVQS